MAAGAGAGGHQRIASFYGGAGSGAAVRALAVGAGGGREKRKEENQGKRRSGGRVWVSGLAQVFVPMAAVALGVVALMELSGHGLATLTTTDRPGGGDARWFVPLTEVSSALGTLHHVLVGPSARLAQRADVDCAGDAGRSCHRCCGWMTRRRQHRAVTTEHLGTNSPGWYGEVC